VKFAEFQEILPEVASKWISYYSRSHHEPIPISKTCLQAKRWSRILNRVSFSVEFGQPVKSEDSVKKFAVLAKIGLEIKASIDRYTYRGRLVHFKYENENQRWIYVP
jgi:hypothetical protein